MATAYADIISGSDIILAKTILRNTGLLHPDFVKKFLPKNYYSLPEEERFLLKNGAILEIYEIYKKIRTESKAEEVTEIVSFCAKKLQYRCVAVDDEPVEGWNPDDGAFSDDEED